MVAKCRDWYAWIDEMPPGPKTLHVTGEVVVGNPGVEAILTMREPAGINPTILILDLHLVQRPGEWIQVVSCTTAKFERPLIADADDYSAIEIFDGQDRIAFIDQINTAS